MRIGPPLVATLLVTLLASHALADRPFNREDLSNKLPSISMMDEMVSKSPGDPKGYVLRAFVYQYKNKYPEALDDFTKAIEFKYRDPDDPGDKGQKIYGMRAACYLLMKNIDAAIADSNKALAMAPNDAQIMANRGAAYGAKKQYALAMKDYTRALQIDSSVPSTYEGIGEVCFKTGQYANAILYLNRAISLNSKDGEAYYFRGATHRALGKKLESENDFKRATELGYTPGQVTTVFGH